MNSETPHSFKREFETKTFSKFGLTFVLHIATETRPEWAQLVLDADGNQLDLDDEIVVKAIDAGDLKPVLNWEMTGQQLTSSYITAVQFQDKEDCTKAKSIELFSTSSGPILGIVLEEEDNYLTLLDPAVVNFNNNRKITYSPIFNVGRKLKLHARAVHSRQPPAEVVAAGYPAFILQNRMFKNQLKPVLPFAAADAAKDEAPLAIESEAE